MFAILRCPTVFKNAAHPLYFNILSISNKEATDGAAALDGTTVRLAAHSYLF